jgi:lysophospholipase L1-like esterase
MLLVVAAFIGVVVAVLGVEVLLARGGARLDEFDVTSLNESFEPPNGATPAAAVRVLWLGDSTAAGVGASSPNHAVSAGVARIIAADRKVTVEVRVVAKSGARVADVADDQVSRVGELRPDVVVISVGANDTIHLTSVAAFGRLYRKVLDDVAAAGIPASRIVVVGVPDMGAPPRLRQPLRAIVGLRGERLDREARRVALAHGAHYVDLFAGTSSQFRADQDRYFSADNYHPSDAGYALWSKVIAPSVENALAL